MKFNRVFELVTLGYDFRIPRYQHNIDRYHRTLLIMDSRHTVNTAFCFGCFYQRLLPCIFNDHKDIERHSVAVVSAICNGAVLESIYIGQMFLA